MAEESGPISSEAEKMIPAISSKGISARPFRILSLNGGGMRGIYQAFFLDAISKSLEDKPLCNNFELIIGTSTGSLVGLAIALGIELKDVLVARLQVRPVGV